jgi:hypothetical protein
VARLFVNLVLLLLLSVCRLVSFAVDVVRIVLTVGTPGKSERAYRDKNVFCSHVSLFTINVLNRGSRQRLRKAKPHGFRCAALQLFVVKH